MAPGAPSYLLMNLFGRIVGFVGQEGDLNYHVLVVIISYVKSILSNENKLVDVCDQPRG